MPKNQSRTFVEYATASMIIPGQTESGDLYIVKETEKSILIGVVDGLGHGKEAAAAAKLAVEVLKNNANGSIINAVKLCHEKLKATRGTVMALVSINLLDETITWLSIGNVDGMILRANLEVNPVYENIIMRPGVIGYRLPQIYASVAPISKGDIIILSTDGISEDYIARMAADAQYLHGQHLSSGEWQKDEILDGSQSGYNEPAHAHLELNASEPTLFRSRRMEIPVQELSNYIKKRFAKGTDDALVLVARYLGKQ